MTTESYVNQNQVGAGKIRGKPLSPQMEGVLQSVGQELGVYFDVVSGGQSDQHSASTKGKTWTGSHRHDDGNAADVKAYTIQPDGSKHYLDFTKPADQAVWSNIVKLSVANGATGIGAGEGYMGGHTVHIGFGKPATWGDRQSSANTPKWLADAYAAGHHVPPGSVPKVGTALDTIDRVVPRPKPSGLASAYAPETKIGSTISQVGAGAAPASSIPTDASFGVRRPAGSGPIKAPAMTRGIEVVPPIGSVSGHQSIPTDMTNDPRFGGNMMGPTADPIGSGPIMPVSLHAAPARSQGAMPAVSGVGAAAGPAIQATMPPPPRPRPALQPPAPSSAMLAAFPQTGVGDPGGPKFDGLTDFLSATVPDSVNPRLPAAVKAITVAPGTPMPAQKQAEAKPFVTFPSAPKNTSGSPDERGRIPLGNVMASQMPAQKSAMQTPSPDSAPNGVNPTRAQQKVIDGGYAALHPDEAPIAAPPRKSKAPVALTQPDDNSVAALIDIHDRNDDARAVTKTRVPSVAAVQPQQAPIPHPRPMAPAQAAPRPAPAPKPTYVQPQQAQHQSGGSSAPAQASAQGGGGGNGGGGSGGTFQGSSTGNTYKVGGLYSNHDGTFQAQSNGTFKKVA
jgi:hypothetical protein